MPTTAQRPPADGPHTAPLDSASSKGELTRWWRQFKKGSRAPKDEEEQAQVAATTAGIFGVPLDVSIKYANVAISQVDDNGHSTLYGYVPIIVAKCGVFLKEKAIDVEGIFRLAGAERRIKELMAVFNAPERYGRGLDWTGYTVHDAANLLRRYLNQLPEPIVPIAMYSRFREPLKNHQAEAVGPMDQQHEALGNFDSDATIQIFQQLITELSPLNRQLLLYILDLLAVFSSKSDVNRMTAPNLAAIFQPGILRHPDHDLIPSEYRLSQDVIIFLVEHQDHFVLGMVGSAVDERTAQDMQATPRTATTPTTPKNRTQQLIGRSTSSASAGSDQMRRFGDIRRNASTNSRGSRQSQHTPSPVTPPTGSPHLPGSKGSGVYRSNTLPSKKSPSPALSASERFQRFQPAEPLPSPNPATTTIPSPLPGLTDRNAASSSSERLGAPHATSQSAKFSSSPHRSPLLKPWVAVGGRSPSQDRQVSAGELLSPEHDSVTGRASPLPGTPSRERGISSLWKQSPGSDTERRDGRPRNKLQKKRPPGEISIQGSQQNLTAGEELSKQPASPAIIQGQATTSSASIREDPPIRPDISTSNSFQTAHEQPQPTPQASPPSQLERDFSTSTLRPADMALKDMSQRHSGSTMKGREPSPRGSSRSRSTGAEASSHSTGSEGDGLEVAHKEKRHNRWRISVSKKKPDDRSNNESHGAHANLGSALDADRSTSSIGSHRMPRKSYTDDSNQSDSVRAPSSSEAEERATSPRRGPIGWFRGKMQDRQDKREEKERAKSPPPRAAPSDISASSQSLGGVIAAEAPAPVQQQQQQQFHVVQPATQASTQPLVPQPVQPVAQAPTQELQDLSITPVHAPAPTVQIPPAQITTQGLTSAGGLSDIAEAETPKVSQQVEMSAGESTGARNVDNSAARIQRIQEQEHRL